ncbi:MAG: hypothetical protein KIT31_37435 [Deltaproteobacteria bacterium]|nr:hypothetical protein [Deltaproteobacteria bacterium]
MSTRTIAQVHAVSRSVVTCKRCGATMHVSVDAYGEADVTYIDHRDAMESAAEPALAADARRTRRLLRCVGCKRRSVGWVALEVARSVVWLVAAAVVFALVPDREDIVWAVIIGLALYGAISLVLLRRRFRNADAGVVMLAPPRPTPEPRGALPRAVAVSAPPAKPVTSPPQPVTSPPPPAPAQPPLEAGAEPSILTSSDR